MPTDETAPTERLPWSAAGCRQLAEHLGVRPTKRMGQNFLPDQGLLEHIVAQAELSAGDAVLEVGPGLGHLSSILLEAGAELTAVELDGRLADHLRDTFPELTVVEADALEGKHALARPVREWLAARGQRPGAVVANLPYSVASPLIAMLVAEPGVSRLVVLIQHEVARRLLARPGTSAYGPLTVAARQHAEVEQICKVAPSRFWPRPQVESAVVRLIRRPPAVPAEDGEWTRLFVQAAFGARRKTLPAALRRSTLARDHPTLADREHVVAALTALGHSPTIRAEALPIEALVTLSNRLRPSDD